MASRRAARRRSGALGVRRRPLDLRRPGERQARRHGVRAALRRALRVRRQLRRRARARDALEDALTRASRRAPDRLTPLAAALAAGLLAQTALAAPTRFSGAHPVAASAGGGYCYIEAPHLHSYAPDHPLFYRASATGWAFVGDPTPFGYEGERHIFSGQHPVALGDGTPAFCFIDGPHYHAAAPAPGDDYEVADGIAFFVGPFPASYVDERAQRWKPLNDELAPFARFRPAVSVVVPPPAWRGRIWLPPGVKVKLPKKPQHARRTRVRVEVHE
ncbi:MAG TPA: hypothetical protein VF945_07040 [Polyangia bacterium]